MELNVPFCSFTLDGCQIVASLFLKTGWFENFAVKTLLLPGLNFSLMKKKTQKNKFNLFFFLRCGQKLSSTLLFLCFTFIKARRRWVIFSWTRLCGSEAALMWKRAHKPSGLSLYLITLLLSILSTFLIKGEVESFFFFFPRWKSHIAEQFWSWYEFLNLNPTWKKFSSE